MPLQVKINYTTSTAEHIAVLPDATEKNVGVMTPDQVKRLNDIECPCPYDVTAVKTSAYPAKANELVQVAAPESPWGDVTLPAAAGNKGKTVIVKNVANFFAVGIAPGGGDTIDGGGSSGVDPLASKVFVSDGVSNWMIVAEF